MQEQHKDIIGDCWLPRYMYNIEMEDNNVETFAFESGVDIPEELLHMEDN